MGGISLSPGVSTPLSNEANGETHGASASPSAPGTAQPPAEPWLVLSQAQRNHYIGAVPGSRTPLTAVTTSRCSRGEQEAFPAFPFPLILTSACCIHCHLSKHTRLLWFWFMWLNVATVPNWACWVSYSTNVCNAQLGNNLPPAIQLLSAGDGVMKNHHPSISSRSQVPSEVQLRKVQFSKL